MSHAAVVQTDNRYTNLFASRYLIVHQCLQWTYNECYVYLVFTDLFTEKIQSHERQHDSQRKRPERNATN